MSERISAPLSYQGGKQRVAGKIFEIMEIADGDVDFIDLCCGSGAMSIEFINRGNHPENVLMVDQSDWGMFWNQVSEGSFDMDMFEDIISGIPKDKEDIQNHLKEMSKDTWYEEDGVDIIPLWLCLQAGSFGGKHIWSEVKDGVGSFRNASFRSYWKPTATSSRRSPVNPMMPMPSTLEDKVKCVVEGMASIKAICADVVEIDWKQYDLNIRSKDRVIVFIDPPYENTTGYGFNLQYVEWYQSLNLPEGYELWITDYKPHGEHWWSLNNTNKGGISGGGKKREEILSRIF